MAVSTKTFPVGDPLGGIVALPVIAPMAHLPLVAASQSIAAAGRPFPAETPT